MTRRLRFSTAVLALGLSACATYPTGPNVTVLPGSGATFDKFRDDDFYCRAYANQAVGGTAQQSAETGAVNSAVVGTAVGAAAGALIGAASGDAGAGAAIGGGGGLLLGSAAGTDAYAVSGSRVQNRYDASYVQCMYAKGHQVPVSVNVAARQPVTPSPQSANRGYGYPPPGTPPPPGY